MATAIKAFVKSDWLTALLVCSRCSKRLGGGFGKSGKKSLAKALRKHLELTRFRKARLGVVEVKCLGICPRGAVTLVDTRQPERWRLIAAGADLAVLIEELGLGSDQPAT